MMKAGVPLSKIDLFRDTLEEHGYALTSSTNLRQLIPFIHQEELSRIKQEILNQPLSIHHTPQLGGGVNLRLFIVCSKPSVM